ncbi:MAG TPA: ATP-binding protein [Gaiellaceae bacterium]|jgi:signal transduction histidine kinase|nr:ATP-binding protein [Gaiellaceae bacterium]
MSWLRRPAATIRLRLTAIYGGLFLASGTTLLAITYFLLRREYTGKFFINSGRLTDVAVGGYGPRGETSAHFQVVMPAAATAAHAQSVAALHELLVDSGIALAIMAVLSIWLGWLIAGRALRPLRAITSAAREISATSLHRRLALGGPDDELKQLGTTFDDLLERLEDAFQAQRQFVANASHELRTPLTLQRALLELALSDPDADAATFRSACEKVLGVGEDQERLIEALLTLSRSQRGLEVREPVDLAAIAAAAAGSSDRDDLVFETDFEPAETTGDPRLVERLAANLIQNAVKHNRPGGTVTVETREAAGGAVLRVRNSGQKIRVEDLARLFQPFERLERDPNGTGGLGLGLSIVDAVARAHGATLTALPGPEGGLDLEVTFPARAGGPVERSAVVVTAE